MNAYAGGAEYNVYSHSNIDYYPSLEFGIYQSRVHELIPVEESDPPVKRFGPLIILGAEMRWKPMERFHIGPRLNLGVGGIFFTSLLFSAD